MPRSPSRSVSSPVAARPRRLHRTAQRERLLAVLRASEEHPTAAQLHRALLADFPRLSLGTVYRNLDVLVDQGEIEVVPAPSGVLRYDGNRSPHHHFSCESCGGILDIELPMPRRLAARLQRERALRVHKVRIEFIGLCSACSDRADDGKTTKGDLDR
jgi:Fe2+ or Zn2+ uptake regulation protein